MYISNLQINHFKSFFRQFVDQIDMMNCHNIYNNNDDIIIMIIMIIHDNPKKSNEK